MRCEQCREALSARLDGEAEPVPAAWTDRHLAGCVSCRAWQQQAADLSRRLRIQPVTAEPSLLGPRSAERVLARAWRPQQTVRGRRWRIALAVTAAAQLMLGAAQLAGWDAGMMPMRGGMSTHLFDESTAWNIALGVGMAWVAWRVRAAAGLLPVFGGYLLVLAGFCVHDLVTGEVTVARVTEHGLLLIGFALMLAVRHASGRSPGPRPSGASGDAPPRYRETGEPDAVEHPKRRPGGFRLRPVNRRGAA